MAVVVDDELDDEDVKNDEKSDDDDGGGDANVAVVGAVGLDDDEIEEQRHLVEMY